MTSLYFASDVSEDATPDFSGIEDQLKVMKQQETAYRCSDYMATNKRRLDSTADAVDNACRKKMCQWCYTVVDFCNLSRGIVAHAMSYLDRYLCTTKGQLALTNRKTYQLASITALYIAMKIHECLTVEISVLVRLGRGLYSKTDIELMEQEMLLALEWRVNGPIAADFVEHYTALVSAQFVNSAVTDTLNELARYQSELAVGEYDFISYLPSDVAAASLVNAIADTDSNVLSLEVKEKLNIFLQSYSGLSCDGFMDLRANLYQLLMGRSCISHSTTHTSAPSKREEKAKNVSSQHQSPISVKDRFVKTPCCQRT